MNQSSGLQGVVGPLTAETGSSQRAEFAVDQRHQLTERALVAAAPGLKQFRDVPSLRLPHYTAPLREIVHPRDAVIHNEAIAATPAAVPGS